jgi:hypothetical protein
MINYSFGYHQLVSTQLTSSAVLFVEALVLSDGSTYTKSFRDGDPLAPLALASLVLEWIGSGGCCPSGRAG